MNKRTVTTTATASATGVPDLLRTTIEVVHEGSYAADALARVNERTNALLVQLTEAGIAATDVRSAAVDLGPRWNDQGRPDGYRASNALRVTFRDLAAAGGHLDAIARLLDDAVRLGGLEMAIADPLPLQREARAAAVHQAHAQATELATAAGATVGPVRRIVEMTAMGAVPVTRAFAKVADVGVPISAGSQEIAVTVEAEYELT